MYLAIKSKSYACIEYLIQNQAQIFYNSPSQIENSPIFYAIRQDDEKALLLVLSSGVNIDEMKDSLGRTACMVAYGE